MENTSGYVYQIYFASDKDMRGDVFDYANDNKLKILQLLRILLKKTIIPTKLIRLKLTPAEMTVILKNRIHLRNRRKLLIMAKESFGKIREWVGFCQMAGAR